uniref:RRP15-like protein n=1 Tax=Glossina austeni TaxID=7395 RepID=A0A1A9V794_GLOAU
MQTPNKPHVIPEQRKEKDFMQSVSTFVRNVMGCRAGAGSEYQRKLQENQKEAEEKAAKIRAKLLKKNSKKCRLQKSQLPKDDRAIKGSEDYQ